MKQTLLFFTLILLISAAATGQDINPSYDSTLAKKLGADDYGMKLYVLVILKSGVNVIQHTPTRDSLFAGHR